MEGREGCLGIFFGMFIVCPAGWAELRNARGHGLDGCLPTASQTCPTNQLPVLAQGAQCVLTSQESRNHPTPTSLCGADPAEAPRSNHSPALLSVPQNALPWLPSMAVVGNQAPGAAASVLVLEDILCWVQRPWQVKALGIPWHYPELVLVLCR